MWMVVGLGNPGREHEGQRHNAGFLVVDRLADRAGARLSDKKFKARLGRGRLAGEDVFLLEPQTYMNLSGESVGPAAGFYKLGADRLVVVHDELSLPFGRVVVKRGGGHGGHNGLRSLKKHLPDDRFARVRFGIGRPPPAWDPADYVLSRFSSEERGALDGAIDRAADAVETILSDGVERAVSKFD
jgi:PTH1 family peptidyl-tRNA hydrolase